MVERKTPGEIILLVFIYAAVTLVGFVCLYPMPVSYTHLRAHET